MDLTDQLEWHPLILTHEKIDSLWEKFQRFPIAFDDFTKGNKNEFIKMLLAPDSVFYEVGDEIGITAAVSIRIGLDAIIHVIMFDRRLRGRERIFLEMIADVMIRARLRRVTAAIPEDRHTARKLAERTGFTHEGTLRKATIRDGQYLDVGIYGLLREELLEGG
jgi:RimJ/RimL family protein N-acetyltransferase